MLNNNIIKSTKIISFILILYATYLLVLLSIPYLSFKPTIEFLETKQFVYHIKSWRISFYIHVFSSVFILFFGLFQFNKSILKNKPKLHKFFGYTYVILLLLISGPASFIMSLYANGGILAQISFVILSILWIFTTLFSLIAVLQQKYEKHGNWLFRSYALTLSAVTLRFYAFIFDFFKINLDPIETYIIISYLGWIPNLIIAEILIKKGYVKKLIQN